MRVWVARCLLLGCAVTVIVAILAMAARAGDQADRALRAQARMERLRSGIARVDVTTSRSLAYGPGVSEASVTSGLATYVEVASTLRQLQRLDVSSRETRAVERQVAAARSCAGITPRAGACSPTASSPSRSRPA